MKLLSPTLSILRRTKPRSLLGKALSSLPRLKNRSIGQDGKKQILRTHVGGPTFPLQSEARPIHCCRPLSTSVPATSNSSGLSVTSADGVVGTPIDFDLAARIEGNESQIVSIELAAGQVLRAESGALMYMTEGIEMETSTGGGISKAFSRMMTGQNLFLTDYRYTKDDGGTGLVALGTDFPSKIVRLSVPQFGGKLVCQKGALLCASHTIDIQMEYSKNLASGFFGGEGFILQVRFFQKSGARRSGLMGSATVLAIEQGLIGEGEVFLKAGGTLIRRELAEGEQLRISSGCLVAFSNGVDYGMISIARVVWVFVSPLDASNHTDVQMVKGLTNMFAGGEGLFMTTLTGPGVVWLQGQPPERMIGEISRRVPSGGGIGLAVPVGGGGGGGDGGEAGSGSSSSSSSA